MFLVNNYPSSHFIHFVFNLNIISFFIHIVNVSTHTGVYNEFSWNGLMGYGSSGVRAIGRDSISPSLVATWAATA